MSREASTWERLTQRRAITETGCWEWAGATIKSGYGTLSIAGRSYYTHRLAWVIAKGPIPDGLQLDHLCRNRRCFNPEHLEPVTQLENVRRGLKNVYASGYCTNGHELAVVGLRVNGARNGVSRMSCAECRRAAGRRRRARLRAERLTAGGLS